MDVRKIQVTPILAQKWLKENVRNRKISDSKVRTYANDMISGRWKERTGELIKFSTNGKLLDGQHRLLAIVKSQKTIEFDVAYGISESVFDVLDTGKIRSTGDVFSIEGVINGSIIATSINRFLLLKKGNSSFEGNRHTMITNTLVLEEYKSREDFWQDAVSWSIKNAKAFGNVIPATGIAGFYALFYEINPEIARDFFNQVCIGTNVTNNSIVVLRNSLIRNKVASKKLKTRDINAYIIKTWNAFRTNLNYKVIKFDSENESFPKPV